MKLFKRIYYPVMAALVVLMLVLSIVDARVATVGGSSSKAQVNSAYDYATRVATAGGDTSRTHNSYAPTAQQNVQEIIVSTLTACDVQTATGDEDEDGNNTASWFMYYENALPTLYVQKAIVRQEAQANGANQVAVNRQVQNVILAVPGKSTDAILLHARYDSTAIGGASDASAVGALLGSAVNFLQGYDFRNGQKPENTVVFLFGDAGQEGDLGAAAFMHQFAGFDGVAKNVKAAADFATDGTGGALMMYAENSGSLNLIGKYARFNGGTFASSGLPLLFKRSDYKTSGVFGDYNALSFTNRGGFNRYGTASDTSVNKKLVKQQVNAMNGFMRCFANASVAKLDTKSSAVYFSYLDVMTVYYPMAVAFVIAGIILGLMIAVIILNIRNKAFSWGKALAGAAVQLVTLLASALAMLALYYLFALLLCGFGVIPFHALSAVKFAGTGLFVSASIMAVVLAVFFYILLKRTFGVKAADVVRGNTLLFALVAFVLSFAAPGISYPFTCAALFSLVAMLMTVLFKSKFKNKFKTDIERLFLYVWAIVFSLPLFVPLFYVAQTVYPAVSIVIVMTVLLALAGFITPFADYLKPVLDKAFKKLPPHTIRKEVVVTEMVEDRAKKGKFTEVTSKKIVKEPIPWRYLNRVGLSVVAFVSACMIVLFCAFGVTYSSSAVSVPAYNNAAYNDSLLFVYENATATLEVHDQVAYNYIRYAVNDMKWDSDKKAYVKNYNGAVSTILSDNSSSVTVSGNVVDFKILDSSYSQVTVTLKNAMSVASVVFNAGDANRESEEYTFSEQEEIVFTLPFGYENFTMTVKGANDSDAKCDIAFEQHILDNLLMGTNAALSVNNFKSNVADWDTLLQYYVSNKEVGPALTGGIVIRVTSSL